MTTLTSTGGISFSGPIALSGLALAKEYLLKLMDNYMEYMVDMYSLMTDNVLAYTDVLSKQADAEKDQMLDQANSDFTAGLSEGLGLIVSNSVALGGTAWKTRSLNRELKDVSVKKTNLIEAHKEMIARSKPHAQFPEEAEDVTVGSPDDEVTRRAKIEEHRETLRALARRSPKDLEDLGSDKDGTSKRKDINKAVSALRKEIDKPLTPEEEADPALRKAKNAEKEEDRKLIDKATKAVDKEVARLNNQERNIYSQIATVEANMRMAKEFTQGGLSAIGAGVRYMFAEKAADDKAKATLDAGTVQLAQTTLQQSEKTAIDASGQASELVRQLKELQANNSSRA